MGKKNHSLVKDFRGQLRNRLIVVSFLFLVFGAALVTRLFFLQILHHEDLVAQSERQYAGTTKIFYGRGTIYDRNMNELARNIEVESIYVTPSEILDRKHTAGLLASHLHLDRERIRKKIASRKNFVWIKRKCNLAEVEKLRRLHLPGVGFVSEQKRFYPKRELAAGVTGFVGMDNQGLAGVEHFRHTMLKGTTIRQVMEKDARGRTIRTVNRTAGAQTGSHDVVLTLDEVIQFTTEYHLKRQMEKYHAKAGMAVVMDPYTGEIYAMAGLPRFNPNNYAAFPPQRWINSVVSNAYEPGSIFKPVVAAAAIDSGMAKPGDIFFCENGKFRIGGVSIGEAAAHKFGWLTLRDIIAKSSNIGAIKIAQRLGKQRLYGYLRKFGFGQKSGIDLPGEAAGRLREVSQWSGLSLASISFGHEIAVTPLQMVASLAAIANGGTLMVPHITKALLKNGKVDKTFPPRLVRRVISEKTSRQIIDILKTTVKNGTGAKAAIPGFDVAGKTGTAQKFDSATQTYSKTNYLASFIGFAPADAPKIVVLVMIDQPRGSYWGGEVAAPVFREISREVLRYLHVPYKGQRVYILNRA